MIEKIRRYEKGFSNSRLTLNMNRKTRNKNKCNGHNKSKLKNHKSKSKNPKNFQHHKSKKDIACWNCGKMRHYKK